MREYNEQTDRLTIDGAVVAKGDRTPEQTMFLESELGQDGIYLSESDEAEREEALERATPQTYEPHERESETRDETRTAYEIGAERCPPRE